MTLARIQVDGTAVSFEDRGAALPLVLLHAFPLSSDMWEEILLTLSMRQRVIAVDARGFGKSDASAGPLTMDRIADDAAAVLDHLGLPTAVLAGCSMGGYAALSFARRHHARLRGLVLIDTRAAPDSDQARAGRLALAARVQDYGAAAAAEAMLPKLLGATSHRERPALVDRVRRRILESSPVAIVRALHGLGLRPDSRPTLAAIRTPCLIIRGVEDAISSEADTEEMARGIAGSRAVMLPGTGHLPSLEAPDLFGAALEAFLAPLR